MSENYLWALVWAQVTAMRLCLLVTLQHCQQLAPNGTQEKKTAVAKLANCQDGVQELHKAVGGQGPGSVKAGTLNGSASSTLPWDSREGRAIRQLENRLTKAQLKANEAQSLRRVYEQVGRVRGCQAPLAACVHGIVSESKAGSRDI